MFTTEHFEDQVQKLRLQNTNISEGTTERWFFSSQVVDLLVFLGDNINISLEYLGQSFAPMTQECAKGKICPCPRQQFSETNAKL